MDLTRWAFARPHVLLIEGPGGTAARLAVERTTRRRGWPLVDAPADADLLVTVGRGLDVFADRVWGQLSGPRGRVDLVAAEDAAAALDQARGRLSDLSLHRDDAAARGLPPLADADGEMPAGLPMADREPDRDGLRLDVLHVPWGPALPWWPAGLIVHSHLHGDVLAEVEISWLSGATPAAEFWAATAGSVRPARAGAAARLDALTRLLAAAGWDAERLRAQRLRDQLLTAEPTAWTRSQLHRLHRRVGRSSALARMTSGLSVGGTDVTTRYRQWLAEAVEAVQTGIAPAPAAPPADVDGLLAEALSGVDLGAARLLVAGLDPELSGARLLGADHA